MKNDQSKPDTKPLWGLKKTPLTHKPKEERILDTVNRVITCLTSAPTEQISGIT